LLVRFLQKHREPSDQEQTLPSVSLPQGLAEGTPAWLWWGTFSLPLPDVLLTAKREKPILPLWDYQFPAVPHKGVGGRKGGQKLFGVGTLPAQTQRCVF